MYSVLLAFILKLKYVQETLCKNLKYAPNANIWPATLHEDGMNCSTIIHFVALGNLLKKKEEQILYYDTKKIESLSLSFLSRKDIPHIEMK